MRIFCDLHHNALATSLQLLLEKRLGHQLFFPYGIEWFDDGYWKIGDPYGETARNTAIQFLAGGLPKDGTGVVTVPNKVTLDEFKHGPKFDVVIASYRGNIPAYMDLIKKYQPKAKLVAHYGNEWSYFPGVWNYMCSTAPMTLPDGVNQVFYHQEFDLMQFRPSFSIRRDTVASFTNAIRQSNIYNQDWRDFLELERLMPDYDFESFGGGCRDGSLRYPDAVANCMRTRGWGFHLKSGGDGYGHVIHNWAAVGRPVIFRSSQYKGKLAEVFLTHEVTGVDLDVVNAHQAAKLIPTLNANKLGDNIYQRFKNVVDFDREGKEVQSFLEDLR